MNSKMIEEFVSRAKTFGSWERNNLEEIYQEGYEAGKKAGLQWLPIETAPKDGTLIVLTNSEWENILAVGNWDLHCEGEGISDFYYWDIPAMYDKEDYHDPDYAPTHWLPLSVLPPAPEVSGD